MLSPAVKYLLILMASVESGNNPAAIGDWGRAIGLYQIHRQYWQDAGLPGRWEDCKDPGYAQQVVLAYWKKYCPEALQKGDLQTLARIHNGGPKGHQKALTRTYWHKIQTQKRQRL